MGELDRPVPAALGHRFADSSLLELALSHRSLTAEGEGDESNERLEFLGDAVLSLIVATELHEASELSEGEMAKVRAAVVNEATLAAVARSSGLAGLIRMGKGEEASGGRAKPSILADAMEAVIGAVYLDGGLEAARRMVLARWRPLIADRSAEPGGRDYKTRLQEVLVGRGLVPEYQVVGTGPDHARAFSAEVAAGGDVLGSGMGSSKKRAEQDAARSALEALGDEDA
ncbi:MAG: ribonuclease III [Actinobacteria bacterium RBG_16_68_21]|nr:MAG: ribonuclease III [Actinobacteria bacterium RBG_16_68_21]